MGILESKELNKDDPRFAYEQNDDESSSQNRQTNQNNPATPSQVYKGTSKGDKMDEEDKFAQNTKSSFNDNDVVWTQRESSTTPFKDQAKRKQVFAAMTSRVLHNKENRKGLANVTNRYDKINNQKNIDPDGIEWVKKDEIIESSLVSAKPYGTKHPKNKKMFGPGSANKIRLVKARSGVMTYLPPQALATILSYDMSSYRKFMSVWAAWHVNIREAFDQYFNKVENEFLIKYQEHLLFTDAFTSSAAIKFWGKRGLRVDRIIVFDILPFKPQLNRTLKISYTFRYHGEDSKRKYRAEYRIDIVKNRKRMIWMHVDRETECTYQQTIFQWCPDDTLELALHLFSLRGMVDVNSIEWNDPEIYETPSITTLTYNKDMINIATSDRAIKIYADINRVWELEDTVVEWYDEKYYENKNEILNFDFLKEFLTLDCVEYSGVDNKVVRIQTRAVAEGYLEPAYFGLGIKIKNSKNSIRNEVKRKGLISERNVDIEMRVGDTFIIYITRAKSANL